MIEKLKRCPFCNGRARLNHLVQSDGYTTYNLARVECTKCKNHTREFITDGYYGVTTTEQDAIDIWNKRVKAPDVKVLRAEAIKEFAERLQKKLWGYPIGDILDDLVKEMTEGER